MLWQLRLLIYYCGVIPVTVIIASAGILATPLPSSFRYWLITRWSHFFIWWAKIVCNLSYQVSGLDNLPKSPCVVLANHQSNWETIFMQVLLPPQSWILKKSLLRIPFFGWALALLWPIAVDRSNKFSVKAILTEGKQRLAAGRWIILFPEGTRVAPDKHQAYSRTGAALAIAAGVPIVPIAHNAGVYWPKGPWIKHPGVIKVIVGAPIDTKQQNADQLTEQVETWIRAKQRQL